LKAAVYGGRIAAMLGSKLGLSPDAVSSMPLKRLSRRPTVRRSERSSSLQNSGWLTRRFDSSMNVLERPVRRASLSTVASRSSFVRRSPRVSASV
jgi:hypothetical protein